MAEPPPTVPPPPKRKLSAPRALQQVPPVVEESEPRKPISDRSELVLNRLAEVEARAKDAIVELTDLYERQLAERDREIEELRAERDREIEALRRGDNTLNEAVEQLREANLRVRAESQAMITSAVTLEVSKHFVSNDEADTKIKGAGQRTQIKSLVGSILVALVSSGALVQIMQSCQDHPKHPEKAFERPALPQPNPANPAGIPGK